MSNIKDDIGYDGKAFTEHNLETMNSLSPSEKGALKNELSAEDWVNIHKYLVSRMTGDQQTIVDSLLNENGRELVDVDLPLSRFNHTKDMLFDMSNASRMNGNRIQEQRNRILTSQKYHPIFDHKATTISNKSWNTDFQLNLFDPYQEYNYLQSVLQARGVIAKMVAEQGLKSYIELSDLDDSLQLATRTIDHTRVLGQCKFDNKCFYGYRFTNIFSDTCGAALFPAYVMDSVFIDCRFNNMSFVNTQFVDCLFIDCTFDACDFQLVTFESCELLNVDFDDLKAHESGRVVFNHCYLHERRESNRLSTEYGQHSIQPWDDPLQIHMDPHCGRNSADSSLMFSGCVGVPTNASFLNMLERDSKGFICYKRIGQTSYPRPDRWVIKNGSFISENMNNDKLEECERGVNVSNFFFAFTQYYESDLWVCRIRFEDAADICVPWGSGGKFRASRVELLHRITTWETQIKIVEREIDKWNKAKLIPRLMDEVETRHDYVCTEFISNPAFKHWSRVNWWFNE